MLAGKSSTDAPSSVPARLINNIRAGSREQSRRKQAISSMHIDEFFFK
jgi:hypothetical protein